MIIFNTILYGVLGFAAVISAKEYQKNLEV